MGNSRQFIVVCRVIDMLRYVHLSFQQEKDERNSGKNNGIGGKGARTCNSLDSPIHCTKLARRGRILWTYKG